MTGTANGMQQPTWVGRPLTIMLNRLGSNEAAAVARSLETVCQSSAMLASLLSPCAEAWAAVAASLGKPASDPAVAHQIRCGAPPRMADCAAFQPQPLYDPLRRAANPFGVPLHGRGRPGSPPPKKKLSSTSRAHQGAFGQCAMLCVLPPCVHKPTSMGDRLMRKSLTKITMSRFVWIGHIVCDTPQGGCCLRETHIVLQGL